MPLRFPARQAPCSVIVGPLWVGSGQQIFSSVGFVRLGTALSTLSAQPPLGARLTPAALPAGWRWNTSLPRQGRTSSTALAATAASAAAGVGLGDVAPRADPPEPARAA